ITCKKRKCGKLKTKFNIFKDFSAYQDNALKHLKQKDCVFIESRTHTRLCFLVFTEYRISKLRKMKIHIFFVCLIVFVVENMYVHANCPPEVKAELKLAKESINDCQKNKCPAKCAIKKETGVRGTLTEASLRSSIQRRCEGKFCGRIENLLAHCLTKRSGTLSKNSRCSDWTNVGSCFSSALQNICGSRNSNSNGGRRFGGER
ncbi:unnamed protein product, partial [Allacma fusca]